MKPIEKYLQREKINMDKMIKRSKESLEMSEFVYEKNLNPKPVNLPFPHIIIENFFKEEFFNTLEDQFKKALALGTTTDTKKLKLFHAFEIDYDGYVFVPNPSVEEGAPLQLFFSLEWNHYFSKIFKQDTGFETSLAFHHHPSGDKTGFVHNDFADKYFDSTKILPNGMIPVTSMISTSKPQVTKRRRIIAILFYLNNKKWNEGDGGETGLYSSDKKDLLKKVPPINNTLLAFQISKDSMHAFQENFSERNCIVQWFHIEEELL